mgnify:CR=1 FL=1
MRGSKVIETILEALRKGAEGTAGLLDVLNEIWSEKFRDRQKFYRLLNHLKSQGLIEGEKRGKKTFWQITKKGGEKLALLRERNLYGKEGACYEAEGDDTFKIITYDIPIAEDKKRSWLRWSLENLGFTLLQKSVWVGKKKIPEKFLINLRKRKMITYIHIFEVRKSGTLKEFS